MRKRLSLVSIAAAALVVSCVAPGPVVVDARPAASVLRAPSGSGWSGPIQDRKDVEARLLAAHNRERVAAGVPPLTWDPALAASAAAYGPVLASSGGLDHAPPQMRVGQGENLWMGTRGAFTLERMVADWASEKSMFRPGIFPNVSETGRWPDVGHYTQIIWPGTTRVGCALQTSGASDYLICRYSPPGNVDGQRVP